MNGRSGRYIPWIGLIVLFAAWTDGYGQSGGDFEIIWSTTGDSSGSISAAGDFTLQGTIGQSDAGTQLSSGDGFGHRNGYWVFRGTGSGDIVIYCYKDGDDVRIEWVPFPEYTLYDVYYGNDKLRRDFYILERNVEPPYLHSIGPDDHNDYYYDVHPAPWK